jgi:hypothetical protein
MFALLIAIGALFLAVAVSAAINPPRDQANDDHDGVSTMSRVALSA